MRYTANGPQGYYYEEIEVGDVQVTQGRTITEADIVNFGGITGDFNPLHFDAEYMKNTFPNGQRMAHGMLVLSFAIGLVNQLGTAIGTVLAFNTMTINFYRSVVIGDTIRVRITVTEKREDTERPGGWITQQFEILNQRDELIQDGRWGIMFAYKPKDSNSLA
jgi:3-hydroxybutyryl-CoA dehydratase